MRTGPAGADTLGGRRASGTVPLTELAHPSGWFALATSGDLLPGGVVPARLGDDELVLWRTAGGSVAAASAWCPHLGANLGRVGRVRGELLECGFHGFCFDLHGGCRATGYGRRVPPRAMLRTWPVLEVAGVVLAWLDPAGNPPSWTIPEPIAGDASALGGRWTATAWHRTSFAGHPIEITENSVDVGHLSILHGYRDVEVLEAARVTGPVLRARYRMTRPGRLLGLPLPALSTEFSVVVHGLGVSIVEVVVQNLGARLRLFVLPTPVAAGFVELRVGVTAREDDDGGRPAALTMLPASLLARAIRAFALLSLRQDVGQDRLVWQTKRHVLSPVLAEGDGPIGLYRRWARQFIRGTGVTGDLGHGAPEDGAPEDGGPVLEAHLQARTLAPRSEDTGLRRA